ncbi:MAG: class I tRNA ligase family protein, partial [Candidatus Woesearchaeota archaeon]
EGKDQVRGWFNLLMVAGVLALDRQSYKNVYMHGFVQDALGRKMSKSLGNYIEPKEVIDKYGADTFRFYAIGGANPGIDLNYNHEDAKLKYKNLIILWNIHNYLIDLA